MLDLLSLPAFPSLMFAFVPNTGIVTFQFWTLQQLGIDLKYVNLNILLTRQIKSIKSLNLEPIQSTVIYKIQNVTALIVSRVKIPSVCEIFIPK